jgi:hypothetical protein
MDLVYLFAEAVMFVAMLGLVVGCDTLGARA